MFRTDIMKPQITAMDKTMYPTKPVDYIKLNLE